MSLDAGSGTRTGSTAFQENDTSNVLFDETSVTNVSAVIQIDDEPAIIRAHHLGDGEQVLVEIVDGSGAGDHYSAYMRNGSQVRLTRKCNVAALSMPGRYRFILQGVVGVAYVRQFRASMTHEFLLESQTMGCCDEFPTSLPPSGPAGGDLTGDYPNPAVDPLKVADRISDSDNALLVLANALCSKLDECIASVFRRCDGSAHVAGDSIPTCQEMQDAIAKVASSLVDCNGNPFTTGAHVPTCDQVDSKIAAAVGAIPADKFLQDVQYDPATHTITFKVADGGDTFTVNLSDLLPIVVGQGLTGNGTVATPVAVKLSADAGNHMKNGSDGGLYSSLYTKRSRLVFAGANGLPLNNGSISTLGNQEILDPNAFHLTADASYQVNANALVPTFRLDAGTYDIMLSTSFLFLPTAVGPAAGSNCVLYLVEVTASGGVWQSAVAVPDVAQMWQATLSGLAVNRQAIVRGCTIRGDRSYALLMTIANAGASPKLNLLNTVSSVAADGSVSQNSYSTAVAALDFLA